MSDRSRPARWLLALSLASAVGCARKKEAQLPPAQGPGAAPLAALPPIPRGDRSAGESTTVAPTEGRTTGTTYPRAEAQIGPNMGGVLSRILVKEGDPVKRGTTLFRQDARDAGLRVEQAKAAREAARVNLRATETEWNRTKSMFEQNAVNQMTWDQVQARMDGARVGLQQAEVMLDMADKARADATVRSPIDGVVTAKLKSEGEMATMMPPTVVLVIQDQSTLELRFRLSERSLSQVKIGDVVTAKFEALGTTRPAKVVRINPTVDARSRTVEVVAEIPNHDGGLKSGLLAEVQTGDKPAAADAAAAATTARSRGPAR